MHPYYHAVSSQRLHGGRIEDTLALHQWFDATKAAFGHFLHRMLRHHQEGIRWAERIFGPTLALTDDQGRMIGSVPTRVVGEQHLLEDCKSVPCLRDWLQDAKLPAWAPTALPTVASLCQDSARRFGGTEDAYQAFHQWFFEPMAPSLGISALAIRHHAWGAFDAEAEFGTVLSINGRCIPTRVVAERHIERVLNRPLPAAAAWLSGLCAQRWMNQADRPPPMA